jgi:CubicO group peptidase (beta-lactamase class C family)
MKLSKLFLLSVFALVFNSCHVGRYFYWNFADINDYKKFPQVAVASGDQQPVFYYPEKKAPLILPEKYVDTENSDLSSFLGNHKTASFLLIQNDTITFEEYFSGFDATSVMPSFSVSKVFVSALTGIAIQEGYIQSTAEPITQFLPELLQNDPDFSRITIEDLLNMRSGIDFTEAYGSPFADMAKYYYGRNLKKYISRLKISSPPDSAYDYISVNTLLLAMAIERATSLPLNQYLSEKIWQPLGMEFDATMNTDSRKGNQIKAFCCLNARTRDFARLGKLYLNGGYWNGRQIVPEQWVERSMSVINNSRDSQGYPYTYQWRVKADGAVFAKGVLGQYIYVDQKKNIIIVRMGKNDADVNWAQFFEDICNEMP